jgi:hypothetical protein
LGGQIRNSKNGRFEKEWDSDSLRDLAEAEITDTNFLTQKIPQEAGNQSLAGWKVNLVQ